MYQCEWEREDCATKGMSTADMLKYYKAESVRGWCRFYLADPGDMSEGLRESIRELLDACGMREKPIHRTRRDQLRRMWMTESMLRRVARAQTPKVKPVRHLQFIAGAYAYAPGIVVPGPSRSSAIVRRYAKAA